jgi:hypothetical protein
MYICLGVGAVAVWYLFLRTPVVVTIPPATAPASGGIVGQALSFAENSGIKALTPALATVNTDVSSTLSNWL